MIGLDTNVLVRYLTQDDPAQSRRATRLVEQQLTESTPGFIGLVVLVELAWVLQRLYAVTADELSDIVDDLLTSRELVLENRDVVSAALRLTRETGCGLPDAIILASANAAGCGDTVTFDRGARRAGMVLVP